MAAETPKIELIYDADYPNVGRARERLSQAVAERGQGDGTLDPSPPVAAILTALREQTP